MAIKAEPLPIGTPLVDTKRYIDPLWVKFLDIKFRNQLSATTVLPSGSVMLVDQDANISTTSIGTASVTAGMYRLSYQARITTPDGVSSSLTVTLGWPDLGQALTFSGAAMTGDSVTTWQDATKFVYVDNGGPVTYSTVYASNTPGQMKYVLRVGIERYSS